SDIWRWSGRGYYILPTPSCPSPPDVTHETPVAVLHGHDLLSAVQLRRRRDHRAAPRQPPGRRGASRRSRPLRRRLRDAAAGRRRTDQRVRRSPLGRSPSPAQSCRTAVTVDHTADGVAGFETEGPAPSPRGRPVRRDPLPQHVVDWSDGTRVRPRAEAVHNARALARLSDTCPVALQSRAVHGTPLPAVRHPVRPSAAGLALRGTAEGQ